MFTCLGQGVEYDRWKTTRHYEIKDGFLFFVCAYALHTGAPVFSNTTGAIKKRKKKKKICIPISLL